MSDSGYPLPIGRDEDSTIVKPGNWLRRELRFWLRPAPGGATPCRGDLCGSQTYASVDSPGSAMLVLPPGASVRVRFSCVLQIPASLLPPEGEVEGIRNLEVHAAVEEYHYAEGPDKFTVTPSVTVRSERAMTVPLD